MKSNPIDDVKKDIASRLKLSDEKNWKSLSKDTQKRVVEKYLEIRNEDFAGLKELLRENAKSRREFGLLFIGLILGVCTNVIAAILVKYFPQGVWNDIASTLLALLFLVFFILNINRWLAEDLGSEKIINRLLDLIQEQERNEDELDLKAKKEVGDSQ